MMDELEKQDPLNPSSSDPTQYLTELAQMTSVEQETNTAQNTQDTAQAQSVSQAVGLIGDTVTYVDQTTGDKLVGHRRQRPDHQLRADAHGRRRGGCTRTSPDVSGPLELDI